MTTSMSCVQEVENRLAAEKEEQQKLQERSQQFGKQQVQDSVQMDGSGCQCAHWLIK